MKKTQTLYIDEFDKALNASRLIRIATENGIKIIRNSEYIYVLINENFVCSYILDNTKTVDDYGNTNRLKLRNRINKSFKYYIRFKVDIGFLKIYILEEELQEWQEESEKE